MDSMITDRICPLIVDDINYWQLFKKRDTTIYCLGSNERDKYLEVPETSIFPIMTALKFFDGKHTIEDIGLELLNNYNLKIDVEQLYIILCKANLLENGDKTLIEKQELDILTSRLFEIKLQKTYWILEKLNNIIFPYGIYFSIFIILCGLFFIIKSINIFISPSNYLIANSYSIGIVFTLVSFFFSIGFHELSHALVGYRFGLKPSKIVFALYVTLSPMIYLKMPGIYSINPKKRIYVWLAGVYANLLLSSIFMIISLFINGDSRSMLLLLTLTNISLVITNLSPLLPLDGYFILCTILKKPNLRKGSFKEFRKWLIGKDNNFRGISIIYFIFSTLFMGGLIFSQIYWIIAAITKSVKNHYSIVQIALQFKFILILFSIMLMRQIISLIIKRVKTHRYKASTILSSNKD